MITNSMQTAQWPRLFFWIAIGVGLLAASGSNSNVAADETLEDSKTIDDIRIALEEARDILRTLPLDGGPVGEDNPLSDSTWTFQSGSGPDGEVLVNDSSITMTFNDETLSFYGNVACNHYSGTYSIDGSTIKFVIFKSTLMGCGQSGVSDDAFFAALADVDNINLLGDKMALTGIASKLIFDRGEPLPVAALLDQLWFLQELTSNDEESAPVGEPATLRIDSDGSFTGTTGCRALTGRYLISGNSILFDELAANGDCPASLSDQDGRVIRVLGDEFTLAINGSSLIVSAGNQRLRYRKTNEDETSWLAATSALTDAEILIGVEWIFVGGESPDGPIADPQSIDSTSSITLIFSDDQYSGNVVCNAYGGEADLDGPSRFTYDELKGGRLAPFTLGEPEGEEKSCGDELDEIAAAYRNALPLMSTGGFYSAGQGLYMYSFGGDESADLRFERAQ